MYWFPLPFQLPVVIWPVQCWKRRKTPNKQKKGFGFGFKSFWKRKDLIWIWKNSKDLDLDLNPFSRIWPQPCVFVHSTDLLILLIEEYIWRVCTFHRSACICWLKSISDICVCTFHRSAYICWLKSISDICVCTFHRSAYICWLKSISDICVCTFHRSAYIVDWRVYLTCVYIPQICLHLLVEEYIWCVCTFHRSAYICWMKSISDVCVHSTDLLIFVDWRVYLTYVFVHSTDLLILLIEEYIWRVCTFHRSACICWLKSISDVCVHSTDLLIFVGWRVYLMCLYIPQIYLYLLIEEYIWHMCLYIPQICLHLLVEEYIWHMCLYIPQICCQLSCVHLAGHPHDLHIHPSGTTASRMV